MAALAAGAPIGFVPEECGIAPVGDLVIDFLRETTAVVNTPGVFCEKAFGYPLPFAAVIDA